MRIGKQTIIFENKPVILETGSAVGPKEKEGPLGELFDTSVEDVYFGETTFEKAESKFMAEAIGIAINKSNLTIKDIDYAFAGDLLNQCISSGYSARNLSVPFFRTIWCLFYLCRSKYLSSVLCKRRLFI